VTGGARVKDVTVDGGTEEQGKLDISVIVDGRALAVKVTVGAVTIGQEIAGD